MLKNRIPPRFEKCAKGKKQLPFPNISPMYEMRLIHQKYHQANPTSTNKATPKV